MKVFKTKGSAILTTIFILFGILTVAMIGLEIIMSGLASQRAQGASAKAFWAAETGIERASMAFKLDKDKVSPVYQPLFASCSSGSNYLKFCAAASCEDVRETQCLSDVDQANKTIYYLNNDSAQPGYWVKVRTNGRNVQLTSRGNYLTTSREIYVSFCLPDCYNKTAPAEDGCGGVCK